MDNPSYPTLEVSCWCESHTVGVYAHELKQGRTGTCNNPWCKPPEGVKNASRT